MHLDPAVTAARRRAFRALHDGPALFIIPNAWDVITARVYEEAGFPTIATSSAALSNSLGFPDGSALPVELHLATLERIVRALDVPLSADVENGYADAPDAVAAFVARLAGTGVAGYNLEARRTSASCIRSSSPPHAFAPRGRGRRRRNPSRRRAPLSVTDS